MMMRIAPVLATAAVLVLAPVSGRAQHADPKDPAKVKSYTLPAEAGGPAMPMPLSGGEARKGAPMGVKQTAMRAGRMADEKLEEAIATLNQLIEASDDDDPSKPEYLARLAALYWDKAENFFNKAYGDELFLRLKAAQDAGDEAGVAQVQAEQAQLLKERVYWQEEAANVYMMIVDRFPDYPSIDSVLYYLGFALVQMDMQDKAFPYFTRIVREDGEEPLGWGTAFMRLVGYMVSGFILYIGFLMIAFNPEKKGLHDMIAKTRVLKVR